MFQAWPAIFFTTLQTIGVGIAHTLPQILLAIVLVILGAVVGAGFSRLLARVVTALKVDVALESAGIARLVARSGYTLNTGALLGGLVQWFIILIFVVAAFDALGLDQVNIFLREVVLSYLPRVIAAVLILISAALVAEFMHTVVVGTSRAADVRAHYLLGTSARVAIWAFAILAALNELHVATAFVQTIFMGIVVGLSLAFGLAFGLGGRDAAARYIEHASAELQGTNDGK